MPPEHEEWADACRRASAERRERDLISHLLNQRKNATENARLFERNKEEKRRKMEERSVQRSDVFDMQKIIPPINLPKEKDNNIAAKKQAKVDASAHLLPKHNPIYGAGNAMASRGGQLPAHAANLRFAPQNPTAAMFPPQQFVPPFFGHHHQGGQYMPSAPQMAAFNFANGGGGNLLDAADAHSLNKLMHLNGAALNFNPQNFHEHDSQKLASNGGGAMSQASGGKSQQISQICQQNPAKLPTATNSLAERCVPAGTSKQQQSLQQQQNQCALQNASCYYQQQQQQQTFVNNNMFFNPPYLRQAEMLKPTTTIPMENPFTYGANFLPNTPAFMPNAGMMYPNSFAGHHQFAANQQPSAGAAKVDCNDMFTKYVANPLANASSSSPQ